MFFFFNNFKYILGEKKMQKCNVAVVEGLKVYFSKKWNKNKKYGPTLLLGCLAKSFLISVCWLSWILGGTRNSLIYGMYVTKGQSAKDDDVVQRGNIEAS
jgi:hypothetical protein